MKKVLFPATSSLLLFLLPFSVSTLKATDADNDGIPADWEAFRGTSDSNPADALIDFDGDGLNTYAEYLTLGRPWGNYTYYQLLVTDLPGDLVVSSISWIETQAGNRANEFLFTIHGSGYSRTFLWKPAAPTEVDPDFRPPGC